MEIIPDVFKNFRQNLFGGSTVSKGTRITYDENDAYEVFVQSADKSLEDVEKGLAGKEVSYSQPVLGSINMNPNYKNKPNLRGTYDLHQLLRQYSTNVILNSIIITRANQVSLFTQPVRYSEKGQGFQVRLRDISKKPTKAEKEEIEKIETFIMNTGYDNDINRDSFNTLVRKIVRDTYTYDQVNFEKVFSNKGKFLRFTMVDPSTIYFATDDEGNIPKNGIRYVQVIDGQVVAQFTSKEMAFAVRNPRSSIYASGYGYSELELSLKNFISHENTETFNDRFFSNGGTTRGVLLIKNDSNQSQQALDMFKREWKNTLSGINGSWQIPVINAEDVKFVNMTPTARDMEKHQMIVSM